MMKKTEYEMLAAGFVAGVYHQKGARLQLVAAEARYLLLAGIVGPVSVQVAPTAAPDIRVRNALDHDGDGKSGGSRPAAEIRLDITPAELAGKYKSNLIDYNTLRAQARKLFNVNESRAADIIAALELLAEADDGRH